MVDDNPEPEPEEDPEEEPEPEVPPTPDTPPSPGDDPNPTPGTPVGVDPGPIQPIGNVDEYPKEYPFIDGPIPHPADYPNREVPVEIELPSGETVVQTGIALGTLAGAGLLAAADGPLPFGDAAAAGIVGPGFLLKFGIEAPEANSISVPKIEKYAEILPGWSPAEESQNPIIEDIEEEEQEEEADDSGSSDYEDNTPDYAADGEENSAGAGLISDDSDDSGGSSSGGSSSDDSSDSSSDYEDNTPDYAADGEENSAGAGLIS